MEENNVELLKEKYKSLKIQNNDIENELKVLIKTKEKFPPIAKDEKWLTRYRDLMSKLTEEMECFKKLKNLISESELQELSYEIKAEVYKKIYYDYNLDRFELQREQEEQEEFNMQNTAFLHNRIKPEIQRRIDMNKNEFADIILEEKDFLKKVNLVAYLAHKDNNFFDTSVLYKGEITYLFVNMMKIPNIDENEVVTAALMYSCKKVDSAQEIDRLKAEKNKDYEYLRSLGFSDRFCKICGEHTRYNQPEGNYVREFEGDILEVVENYVGLTMHREDRMAFPIDEAVDLIENKNLQGKDNKFIGIFREFIGTMEETKI